MNMLEVEAKWNKKWEEEKTYKFDPSRIDKKYYVLEMFSYPSGAKLHVGPLVQLRTVGQFRAL